jgi:hypothetical protein
MNDVGNRIIFMAVISAEIFSNPNVSSVYLIEFCTRLKATS